MPVRDAPTAYPTVTKEASRRRPWEATAGWTSLGVGAASLVTGIIFGALVENKNDEYATGVGKQKTYHELQQIADAGNRYETVQIATMVIGAVGLAAGGGLLLWHYLKPSSAEATIGSFFAPSLMQGGLSIMGRIHF
jgi:hypothetical protein